MKTEESKRKTEINEPEEFVIEKDIVVFPKNRGRKYPFVEMSVGDSFIISNVYSRPLMSKYSAAARNWKNKSNHENWKFSVRRTEDGKIRMFRIK